MGTEFFDLPAEEQQQSLKETELKSLDHSTDT